MKNLDTIARHHAEQVRAAVADARLPRLDTGRSQRVWRETRPAWAAVIAAATVVLVFGLLRLLGGPEGDDDVAATTVPTSTVIVGPEGGFVPTGSMTGRCAWCNAVLLDDGRVLVVGGVDEEGPIAEIYDPATWTFTPTERPPYSYPEITDAVLLDDGRVLVVGLSLSDNGALGIGPSNAAIYDPASGSFQSIDWPEGKGSAAVGLADGRVLVVGGQLAGDRITAALVFDPRLDRFTATGLPNVSWGFPITATLLDDGRVLVVGGELSGMAEIYDPQTGTFTLTGSLSTARGGFTATRLVDGRVLIVGGGGQGSAALASAEIYDPDTGTFTPTGPMATARWGHAVAPLPDGRVLVVGGSGRVLVGGSDDAGDRSVEATAEIYDPLTGRFTQAPAPTTSRLAATAVSLTDGRVLVLGHSTGSVSALRLASKSAEIFTLAPVERPVGCCAGNPSVIVVTGTTGSGQDRVSLVIPAGGLEGAIEAYFQSWDERPSFSTGYSVLRALTLPRDCDRGCEIQVLGPGEDRGSEVSVQIAYEGTPPPQAASITFLIETAPPDTNG